MGTGIFPTNFWDSFQGRKGLILRKLVPVKFRTEIQIPPLPWKIGYQSRMVTMGSCFADRIGQRLQQARMRVQTNPMGIAFNPLSLSKLLMDAGASEFPVEDEYVEHHGLWHSLHYHSSFSNPSLDQLAETIQAAQEFTGRSLAHADLLVLTLGTAFAHRWKESWEVVNNCHKIPAAQFEKGLLSVEECTKALSQAIQFWQQKNPRLKVLLTVSPVRHTKEGLAENNLSKSILRLVCHQLTQNLPGVVYFPAFEILNDDLRDYRFYQDDLIHPSTFAEDYIWDKFQEAAFSAEAVTVWNAWQKVQLSLNHRHANPQGHAYRSHLEGVLQQLQQLDLLLDCSEELEHVQSLIRATEMGEYR